MRRVLILVVMLCGPMIPTVAVHGAAAFADPAFQTQWQQGEAKTPNFWGPLNTAKEGQQEQYKEALGGQRTIQYFDKARMELASNSTVMTGLLTVELKTGRMQTGDATFEQRQPAKVNIAGDRSSDGPTYADLQQLPEMRPKPAAGGQLLPYFYRGGKFVQLAQGDPDVPKIQMFVADGPNLTTYIGDPSGRYGDNVYFAFIDFINGLPLPISQTTGYPISPLFVADVKVAGRTTTLLVQAFERRVLTYNPNNPASFRVEFGNIGQHYYTWRYGGNASAPSPSATATPQSVSATYPGKIVYETGPGDTNAPVYVMNADGSGKTKVGDGRSPIFSPDGKRIAYYFKGSEIPNNVAGSAAAIRSVNLDGSATQDEATFSTNSFDTLVRWSPSGHYIAMNGTQNGPGQIALLDTTTGKFGDSLEYLQGSVNLIFDWTQDGGAALWQASKYFAGPRDLYFGDPDTRGDGAARLTHGENQIVQDTAHFYASARISPDRKTIAVAGTRVFFLSVPGQQSPLAGKTIEGLPDVDSLSWSPDGRALAVGRKLSLSRDSSGRMLSIVDIASGQVVTSVPGAYRVDWSRQ